MGASIYTLQWAEQQWERLERGEKLSVHEQRALLLVYREESKRLREKLVDTSYALLEASGAASREASGSVEIVYRNSTWRIRDDDESDERDLTDPEPGAST